MNSFINEKQSDRITELQRLCEEKGIPCSMRKQISHIIEISEDKDACINNYFDLVESNVLPFTKGKPRKITILSDGLCYGPAPEDSEELQQRLTINDRGDVYITYYNWQSKSLRKERFVIPFYDAIEIIQKTNRVFAVFDPSIIVTDVGSWDLTIQDNEGNDYKFSGSLLSDTDPILIDLSCIIRNALKRDNLFVFDGGYHTEMYRIYHCSFDFGGKSYCYFSDDDNIRIGDTVFVPVGKENETATARVISIEYVDSAEELPIPEDKIKRIFVRANGPLKISASTSVFDIIKHYIDLLDIEGLLDMDCPDDEYDGESQKIASLVKHTMTVDEIAELINDVMSRSFGKIYGVDMFIIESSRIKADLMSLYDTLTPEEKIRQEQIQRIMHYESLLNAVSAKVQILKSAIIGFESVQNEIDELSSYYASSEWKEDFADDEAGKFSSTLKRGVLSEDGLYNLLNEIKELKEKLK